MWRFLVIFVTAVAPGAELRPKTLAIYEDYWRSVDQELQSRRHFLRVDGTGGRDRLRQGEILIQERRSPKDPPDGLIHHWEGSIFLPSVSVRQVLDLVQNYNQHKHVYRPEVMDSQTLSRSGEEFRVRLRLLKRRIVTVVLETEHRVRYRKISDRKWESVSRSTKIAEVEGAGSKREAELAPDTGHGYCWRLDSFWRFEEADGGVYLECSSLSLSRDIPFGMSRLLRPIISELPEASLRSVLEQTRRALLPKTFPALD
ncbi:MAG: hypothetical protein NZV14_11785 [Bryobacteraceae bacterium]|nr:hypothetical protein [Bryobacteraceae bacterium]MDW8378834.1 hypothetical protein [Bryobacterales bacterium]